MDELEVMVDEEEIEDENPDEMEVTPDVAVIFASFPEPEIEYDYMDDGDAGSESHVYGEGNPRHVRAIRFKRLALARAERNKNGDLLTRDNLEEIAASVGLMPITDRHPRNKATPHIIGTMTGGYVADVTGGDGAGSYVFADGIMWSGRHPSLVRQTIEGKRLPSIEAVGTQVGCSVCGSWHSDDSTYCAHLKARILGSIGDNVSRLHKGLRTVGTALVPNPAGSHTGFHGGQFFLVAEEESYKETDMTEAEVKELQERLEATLADNAKLQASVQSFEETVAALTATAQAAKDELEAKAAEVAALVENHALFSKRVPALVQAGVDVEGLPVAAWDEATYNAFLTRTPQPRQPQMVVADDVTTPALSWDSIIPGGSA